MISLTSYRMRSDQVEELPYLRSIPENMKSTDITFIYPLGDGSIVCSISYWEEPDNIDIQKLCDTFIGAMEIK